MEEFKEYSRKVQKFYYETLRGTIYDELLPHQTKLFEEILKNFMKPGAASELAKKMKLGSRLHFRILIVNLFFENKYYSVPVVKVWEGKQIVFYDNISRKYKDWKDYLSNNKLPKCTMLFPVNGDYSLDEGNELKLDVTESPAAGFLSKVDAALYTAAVIGDIIFSAASLFSSLKPHASMVTIGSGICNGYQAGRNGYSLYDRHAHDESISNDEALMHWRTIGQNCLNFAATTGQIHFGNSSDQVALMNIANIFRKCIAEGDPLKSIQALKSELFLLHFIDISNGAAMLLRDYCQSNLGLNSQSFFCELIGKSGILLDQKEGGSKNNNFRSLLCIDDLVLRNALVILNSSKYSEKPNEIARTLELSLYDSIPETRTVSGSIKRELEKWFEKEISITQLKFRISYICQGKKTYETISEMCDYFQVGRKEDVIVNGRRIFEGVSEHLTDYIETSVKKYPQLLVYFVEYVQESNGEVELEGFRPYFKKRIIEDIEEGPVRVGFKDFDWTNALNFQKINYCQIKSNEVLFVKPSDSNDKPLETRDVFKLGKKLMGRVGQVDVKFARPGVDWVVVASETMRRGVIVGPKIASNINHPRPINGCYPVFRCCF